MKLVKRMMMAGILMFTASVGFSATELWWEKLITGAQVDESGIKEVLYVDIQNPNASDENTGTLEKPFKSVSAALKKALPYVKKDESVKILIAPGTYRESLVFNYNGKNKGTLVIEGASRNGVIISGSDVLSGWTPKGAAGVYVAKWPYKWGLVAYPKNWEQCVTLQDIVRRRELVFVNGKSMRQVISPSELKRGSFYVDEDKGLIYLWPEEGVELSKALVEIGTRKGIGQFNGINNLVIRNLVFQHDTTPVQGSGVGFLNLKNLLVENVSCHWNNWSGIGFAMVANITARNISANNNGGSGMTGWQCDNMIWEDCEHSHNNWRGVMGNFKGWAVGGSKLLHIHGGIFRNIKSFDNPTHGFWFDSDCVNCLVDKATWVRNEDGIFIEADQGPIVIRDSIIAFNRTVGISSTNSRDILIEGNIIFGNADAQIRILGQDERESWTYQKNNPRFMLHCEAWSLADNVIATDKSSSDLCNFTGWKWFLDSFKASGNLCFKCFRKYYCLRFHYITHPSLFIDLTVPR